MFKDYSREDTSWPLYSVVLARSDDEVFEAGSGTLCETYWKWHPSNYLHFWTYRKIVGQIAMIAQKHCFGLKPHMYSTVCLHLLHLSMVIPMASPINITVADRLCELICTLHVPMQVAPSMHALCPLPCSMSICRLDRLVCDQDYSWDMPDKTHDHRVWWQVRKTA